MEGFFQGRCAGEDEALHTQLDESVDGFGGLLVAADETQRGTLAAQGAKAGPQAFKDQVFNACAAGDLGAPRAYPVAAPLDRKSTRLNSSH